MQSKYEIKAFWWIKGGHSISKDFEVFLMRHIVESKPQDLGPTKCAIQTINAVIKCMLEVQKLEKLLWSEAVANAVYI